MRKEIERGMERGKQFIEQMDEKSHPLIVAHGDGDGVISAAIISQLLDEQGIKEHHTIFLLVRGKEAEEEILSKLKETNSDTVIFLDYTPSRTETYEKIHEKGKKTLTIDHHPGKKSVERDVYINPWRKGELPSASVLCHLLYEKMNGDKDTTPWALMGAYSDTRLKQSLPFLKLSKQEEELYVPSGVFNWNLHRVIELLAVVYLRIDEAEKVFKLVKESIEQENPLLIEEERYGRAKELFEINEEADRQKLQKVKKGLRFDEEAKLATLIIKSELRIKRIIAGYLRTKYPSYVVGVGYRDNGKYHYSFRTSSVNLSEAVPQACEGIKAHGGGHAGAAGATVSSKDHEEFRENLKTELKRRMK